MSNFEIHELTSRAISRDSNIIHDTLDNGDYKTGKNLAGAVADLNNIQIASEYDDTSTYAYGDYCIYEGVLYRCTTAITVAEAWTSAHWTAVMVTDEYKRVRIMTKAQFDLLSNDEKDGFIYVSDYPTKIQDIDNVSLTTSDNNKLLGVSVSGSDISVGAVNPLNGFQIKTYSFNFPNAVGNQVIEVDTGVSEAYLLGCTVDRLVDGVSRYDFIGQYNQSGYCVGFLSNLGSLNVRPYIIDAGGATAYGGRPAKAIFAVKYS